MNSIFLRHPSSPSLATINVFSISRISSFNERVNDNAPDMPLFSISTFCRDDCSAKAAMEERTSLIRSEARRYRSAQYSTGSTCPLITRGSIPPAAPTCSKSPPNARRHSSSSTSSQKKSSSSSRSSHARCHPSTAASAAARWSFRFRTSSNKDWEASPPRPPVDATSCNIDPAMETSATRSAWQEESWDRSFSFSEARVWRSERERPARRGSCRMDGAAEGAAGGGGCSSADGSCSSFSFGLEALTSFSMFAAPSSASFATPSSATSSSSTSSSSSSSGTKLSNNSKHSLPPSSFIISSAQSNKVFPGMTSVVYSIPALSNCCKRPTSLELMARSASAAKACWMPSNLAEGMFNGTFRLTRRRVPSVAMEMICSDGGCSFLGVPNPNHPLPPLLGASSSLSSSPIWCPSSPSPTRRTSPPNANSHAVMS
mmetsp:Transcript_6231/g.13702  ORF Transcript_6231/g.13702 Transcript_6231/m.13702 type:complete len:430 (-) Transcript_6231:354-1643(-)